MTEKVLLELSPREADQLREILFVASRERNLLSDRLNFAAQEIESLIFAIVKDQFPNWHLSQTNDK